MSNGRHTLRAFEPLGRIDEAIIDELRHNVRHLQKLASLVHLSQRPCQQRVRKLDKTRGERKTALLTE
ncbi:AsnC family protein [Pseudomonas sp. LjRoot277]|uniref:AsnC family protein n=1 Tax=Pseudomonas sp. LjRoot277 TaxID=3342307 RepID=UPI003F504F7C